MQLVKIADCSSDSYSTDDIIFISMRIKSLQTNQFLYSNNL